MDGMLSLANEFPTHHPTGVSAEEIIKSLGDSAAFGSLKKLLKQVEDTEVVDVCILDILALYSILRTRSLRPNSSANNAPRTSTRLRRALSSSMPRSDKTGAVSKST